MNYETVIANKNNRGLKLAGMGLDSNIDLRNYFNKTGDGFIQGNFSERFLTLPNKEFLPKLEEYILQLSILSPEDRLGWVCGLGHGVLKTTPQNNVKEFVTRIREAF